MNAISKSPSNLDQLVLVAGTLLKKPLVLAERSLSALKPRPAVSNLMMFAHYLVLRPVIGNESKEVGDKECDNKFNVHEINHTAAEDDNQKEHQMEVEKCKENGLGHSTHASTSRVSSIAPRKANEADAAGEAVEAPTLIVPAPLVEDLIRGREIEQPSSSTRSFTSTTKLSSDLRIHFELKWLLLAEEKKAAKLEKDIAALDEDSDVETDCIKRKREDDEQEEQLKRENDEWKEHAGRLLQLVKKPRR